jgi:hypothetical protein
MPTHRSHSLHILARVDADRALAGTHAISSTRPRDCVVVRHAPPAAICKSISSCSAASTLHVTETAFNLFLATGEHDPLPGCHSRRACGTIALAESAFDARVDNRMNLQRWFQFS